MGCRVCAMRDEPEHQSASVVEMLEADGVVEVELLPLQGDNLIIAIVVGKHSGLPGAYATVTCGVVE